MASEVAAVAPNLSAVAHVPAGALASQLQNPVHLFVVDESSPIGLKRAQLGGAEKVGAATATVADLPFGLGQYQTFADGVIFYTPSFGAFLLSTAIYDKWKTLAGESTGEGYVLQDYLGAPVADGFTVPGGAAQYFERGMIVARTDNRSFVVSGEIYVHYRALADVRGLLGLPASDEQGAASGGRCALFDNGDVYWSADTGAHEVHGSIRARWLAVGGAGGVMGYPLTDECALLKNGKEVGRFNAFANGGAIYFSNATGAWEVYGAIGALWKDQYGGPNGALGFPTSGEANTPDAGGRFNDFERGVIVFHGSGPYAGTFAFGNLELHVQNFESDFSPIHVAVQVHCSDPAAPTVDRWYPSESDHTSNPSINGVIWSIPTLRGATTVNVFMDGLGYHLLKKDEVLGILARQYDITNLWGTLLQTPIGNPSQTATQDHNADHHINFNFTFTSNLPLPTGVPFLEQKWWPFPNFSVSELSDTQFAQTFSDVHEDEHWYFHPFDRAFYQLVYKGMASSGDCFGMCLEALYAAKDRSLFGEPIFNNPALGYTANLRGGGKPDPSVPAEAIFTNAIGIKHGYQIGAKMIDYFLGEFIKGDTHDPVKAFTASRAAYNAGNWPLMCMTSGQFSGGHVVLPYAWDDSTSPWSIHVANPNAPRATLRDEADVEQNPKCVISIDPAANSFSFKVGDDTTYSGNSSGSGRLYPAPYSVLCEEPRTPFWEVFAALYAGSLMILSSNSETAQVTDGTGRTLYQYLDVPVGPVGALRVGVTHRIKNLQSDDKRIPNLAPIPYLDDPKGAALPEVFSAKRPKAFAKPAPAKPPAASGPTATGNVPVGAGVEGFGLQAEVRMAAVPQGNPAAAAQSDPAALNRTAAAGIAALNLASDQQLHWEISSKAGESYTWAMRTAAGSAIVTAPGSSVSDVIRIDNFSRAGQAFALATSAGGAAKLASVTLVAPAFGGSDALRIFEVTSVPMGAQPALVLQHDDAGGELLIQNVGPDAVIGVRIQSGSDAANSATRPNVAVAAGAVLKIIPADWTAANIAKAAVNAHFLDKVGGNVIRQATL